MKVDSDVVENEFYVVGVSYVVLECIFMVVDGDNVNVYLIVLIVGMVVCCMVMLGEMVLVGDVGVDLLFIFVDDSVVWVDIVVYK